MTETAASVRRHAARGDERRTALLTALDDILREGVESLDAVNIADISTRAGVTRSAFYFYFTSKATAVAALMEELYDKVFIAAQLGGDPNPRATIAATISGLFHAREEHQHLYRAMLEARASSPAVRELGDADRESFVPHLAGLITDERAAGRAPTGADPMALASVLLELNDRMLERLTWGGPLERDQIVDTVVHVWISAIYGGPA